MNISTTTMMALVADAHLAEGQLLRLRSIKQSRFQVDTRRSTVSKRKTQNLKPSQILRYFRLPQRYRWDLRSSGVLRSEEWQFLTDVSEQPIGPICKGQDFLTLANGTTGFTSLLCAIPQNSADLVTGINYKKRVNDTPSKD